MFLIIPSSETEVAETHRTAAMGLWLIGAPIWRERNQSELCRQTTVLTKTRTEWKKYTESYS